MPRPRPALFALPLCALAFACAKETPVPANGFEERAIDRDVRHGQGFRVTDVDGDGRLDVVAALSLTDAVHLYVREDPEDPEVEKWARISVSGSNQIVAMDVDVGDIDGDGDLDIAAVGLFQRAGGLEGSAGEVVWYENPGDVFGVWTTRGIAVPNDDGFGGVDGARAVRLADLDMDGDLDVVVGALEAQATRFDYVQTPNGAVCEQLPPRGNGVHWFRNRGNARFDGPMAIDPDLAGVSQLLVADVDADGRADILASASTTHAVVWYRNTAGTDGPRFERRALVTQGGQYYGLDVANLDDDAPLEMISAVTRPNGGYVHLLDAPPELTTNPGALWTTSTVTAGVGALACAADEDCARNVDLCVDVQPACTGTVAEPADPCQPAEICDNGEDDNGDGRVDCDDPTCGLEPQCGATCPDPFMGCSTAQTVMCAVDEDCPRVTDVCADGSCPAVVTNPIVKLADFSGDGTLDLMVAEAGGLLQRYDRQADGSWARRDVRNGFLGITFLQAGDVDGDGRVDLLTTTYELGTRDRVSWWKNLGE